MTISLLRETGRDEICQRTQHSLKREWDRESERSLGSGSSPSLWLNVSGSCEERQSSQLLSSLEVTQNLASGARVG